MTDTLICAYPECGEEFTPKSWGQTRYCSPECGQADYRRRGETAAIIPSDNYLPKAQQMTDELFRAELKKEVAKLKRKGLPLTGPGIGAAEKQQRIAEQERRMAQDLARLIGLGHQVNHMNQVRVPEQLVQMAGECAHTAYVLERRGDLDEAGGDE